MPENEKRGWKYLLLSGEKGSLGIPKQKEAKG